MTIMKLKFIKMNIPAPTKEVFSIFHDPLKIPR